MKKLPYTIIIVGFVDILFFFPVIWLIASVLCGISFVYTPPFDLSLSFKNAPENTAYIDLLVKTDTDDSGYVPFTEPPRKRAGTDFETLNIDESSEIATLNDGGFISYSLHSSDCAGVLIFENGSIQISTRGYPLPIPGSPGESGAIKAAYVDENGNVLGITELAKGSYVGGSDYILKANGSRLVLGYPGRPSWVFGTAVVILYAVEGRALAGMSLFIVLTIANAVRKARERRKM